MTATSHPPTPLTSHLRLRLLQHLDRLLEIRSELEALLVVGDGAVLVAGIEASIAAVEIGGGVAGG